MTYEKHDAASGIPRLAPRQPDSHKGTYGRLLLIGGSRGLSGSIALSGMAAVASGAGLVKIATADCCLETVAGYSPCYMTVPLECDSEGKITIGETLAGGQLHSLIRESNCVAIGPGLGRSRDLQKLVANVVESADCPIVIDADGLNNLANAHIGAFGPLLRSKEVVLTPHPGEWSRLVGVEANNRAEQRAAASRFASEFKTVVVLKGTQTTVTDGRMTIENTTGTPAMATGGSGDVLTGIVAAAICQGMGCLDAARFAVYVHGLAGQIAERETGHFVVPPPTLIHYLPKAMAELNHSTEC